MRATTTRSLSAAGSADLAALKRALRKDISTRIHTHLTQADVSRQSEEIARIALNDARARLGGSLKGRRVSAYLSMPAGEVETRGLLEKLLQEDCEIYVPFVTGKTSRDMILMEFHERDLDAAFGATAVRDRFGVPLLPTADRRELEDYATIDVVFTPGLGFNAEKLARLGRGKGYYDALFARIDARREAPAYKIGLALREQLVAEIPVESHDVPLSRVVTPDTVLEE